MAGRQLPSPELLRKLLRYEPKTGKLFWKWRARSHFGSRRAWASWNAQHAYKEALTVIKKGALSGTVLGKTLRAHRVIWCMVHGYWPQEVDHEDRNGQNNRIRNLRDVTGRVNCQNKSLPKSNQLGVPGIYPSRNGKRWIANIGNSRDGAQYLGTFDTLNQAISARRAAERRLGYHPNHGRKVA